MGRFGAEFDKFGRMRRKLPGCGLVSGIQVDVVGVDLL